MINALKDIYNKVASTTSALLRSNHKFTTNRFTENIVFPVYGEFHNGIEYHANGKNIHWAQARRIGTDQYVIEMVRQRRHSEFMVGGNGRTHSSRIRFKDGQQVFTKSEALQVLEHYEQEMTKDRDLTINIHQPQKALHFSKPLQKLREEDAKWQASQPKPMEQPETALGAKPIANLKPS